MPQEIDIKDCCYAPIAVPKFSMPDGKTTEFLDKYGFSSKILHKYRDHSYEKEAGTVGGWKKQFTMREVDLPDYYNPEANPELFVFEDVKDTFRDCLNPSLPWRWNSLAKEHFPDLIEFIETHLPFRKLTDVTLARSDDNLHPHRDQFYPAIEQSVRTDWEDEHKNYEPLQYRIVFDGTIEGSTYVCHYYDDEKPKTFLKLPQTTNTFAMGATNCFHGSTIGDAKTLVCVFGFLDIKKQEQLIKKSISKYSDYIVRVSDLEK